MNRTIVAILSIVMLGLIGCASIQPVAETDQTFNKVFEVPGFSKDRIFDGTKIWIAENFRSAKAVLEYENKEAGTIIGNGVTQLPCTGLACVSSSDRKIHFTMRVDIKENKFKTTFTNLQLSRPPSYDPLLGARKGYKGPIHTQGDMDKVKPILLQYGDGILTSLNKEVEKSDW